MTLPSTHTSLQKEVELLKVLVQKGSSHEQFRPIEKTPIREPTEKC